MNGCTFFGHSDTPQEIEPILQLTLSDLIVNKNTNCFYVGNHGNYDLLVQHTLKKLQFVYPHISYAVVLAYMPYKKNSSDFENYSNTILPDGLENIPPKYAIVMRNKWMIEQSDYVVTYVKYDIGGAAKFKALSEKKGKIVINLANF